MKPDDETYEEDEAKFNMAIDTLKRLGEILREIKIASADNSIPENERQSIKVGLVRQFVFQSDPLLKDDGKIKDFRTRALALKFVSVNVISGTTKKFLYAKRIYDANLENKLDKLVVDVQEQLKKDKMFMPPKDESGLF